MNKDRLSALRTCVNAVIMLNGGRIHSMNYLASTITKCSRFLFSKEAMYHGDMQDEITALEASVMLDLAGNIMIRPTRKREKQSLDDDFDVPEIAEHPSVR